MRRSRRGGGDPKASVELRDLQPLDGLPVPCAVALDFAGEHSAAAPEEEAPKDGGVHDLSRLVRRGGYRSRISVRNSVKSTPSPIRSTT
jgi:hypothetical protein